MRTETTTLHGPAVTCIADGRRRPNDPSRYAEYVPTIVDEVEIAPPTHATVIGVPFAGEPDRPKIGSRDRLVGRPSQFLIIFWRALNKSLAKRGPYLLG